MAATAKKTNGKGNGGERFAELAAQLRGMSESEIELAILSSKNAAAFKNPKLVASYLFQLANEKAAPMNAAKQANEQTAGGAPPNG